MKLNYKRTILVGFAFFLISMFWTAYEGIIPLILTNKFGMSQFWSGVVMAADNVLAVFLLPIFGALSDKCRSKRGRRTPFIFIGTILASVLLIALSFADKAQLNRLSDISTVDDSAALEIIYDAQQNSTLKTPEGEEFVLSELYSKEEFTSIKSSIVNADGEKVTNPLFTEHVIPAREACAADRTAANPTALICFIALLLGVLLSMSIFRSPAVALMPDVTVKPLRSKGNAIINLMGTIGGMLALVMSILFGISKVTNAMMNYTSYFSVLAGGMLIALGIFILTVREPQWAEKMRQDSLQYGIEENEESPSQTRSLSSAEKRSLILILASIALWYFGYNAVTSKYSVYATKVLQLKDFSMTMLLAQASATIAYIPAGLVASKFGRKKTIMVGVVMLTTAFTVAAFLRAGSPDWLMNILFVLAGVAWATINVNSFPMVVELCSGGDVGKYTGFYYTASMAAQTITPLVSGYLMDIKMTTLFPYAAIFVGLAFVTMALVKHGDSKVAAKVGLEALDVD